MNKKSPEFQNPGLSYAKVIPLKSFVSLIWSILTF
jgi:hypothetical protein